MLEARAASGGTWDLFRYPGIRSDSDMFTMGYRFRPWRSNRALADGPSILAYVRDTAREYGVDRRIRYQHRVTAADWDSATARWTVTAETPDGPVDADGRLPVVVQRLLRLRPALPARAAPASRSSPAPWSTRSTGPPTSTPRVARVVVIGSGATAMTLVPALADAGAGQVTMLQRSPTYVLSLPGDRPGRPGAAPVAARAASYWLHPVEEHRRRDRAASRSAGGGRGSRSG